MGTPSPPGARFDATIASEQDRLAWAKAVGITDTGCNECEQTYPMYLALDTSQQNHKEDGAQLGHGAGSVLAIVNSWMSYKHPDVQWMYYRPVADANMGDMRGRALFMVRARSGRLAS
jgi:hypothetical protein